MESMVGNFTSYAPPKVPEGSQERFARDVSIYTTACFADASKVAFAAAAYIRMLYKDGWVYTNFVMAKSKINPIKPERTIPKLELMAVDTAVLLAEHVADQLKISLEDIYIWTDSKTDIQWLRLPEGTLQVLAHNYCKKIKK
jgi:hypothetical protein